MKEVQHFAEKADKKRKRKKQGYAVQIRYKILFTGKRSSVGFVTKNFIKDYVECFDEIALQINV